MSKVKGSRGSYTHRSNEHNFTHFIIGVLFIASLVGIIFLSFIMNDPASFGWGVLIGLTLFIVFYLLWKKAPSYDLKKRQ
ncbi:MAG: hypothetical protein E3J90_13680 [Promethearchaeota archaeon]|nr:MAG: hypothetical protein E3J90_13680 [Candidatus Lokiarchaeota archaeon]